MPSKEHVIIKYLTGEGVADPLERQAVADIQELVGSTRRGARTNCGEQTAAEIVSRLAELLKNLPEQEFERLLKRSG